MNRIERYLGSVILMHSLLVMLVLMVIFAFFEFMNQIGDLEKGYTLALAGLFTALKMPVYSYEVFPIVLLIGTLMGLGSLANQSELTILRVTGWSIRRILVAVLKTALIMWLVMALMGEWLAPQTETYAKKLKLEALNKSLSIGSNSGFWLKDDNEYLYVKRVVTAEELHDIKIFKVEQGQLRAYNEAKRAIYVNDGWVFENLKMLKISPQTDQLLAKMPKPFSIKLASQDKADAAFFLKPEDLTVMGVESRYLNVVALNNQITFLQQNNLDASEYELSFWRKLAMPVVVIAMIAVVFPLIFGSMRQVSIGQRIFLGVLIGMGFHLVNQLIGNIAVVYQLPIVFMVFFPALVVMLGSWLWLKKVG